MSYDVNIECPHCATSLASFNYTYNLAEMFRWALGGDGLWQLGSMSVGDAIPLLEQAIAKCEADGNLSHFDAPNGWGHGTAALAFLRNILKAAQGNPGMRITVS